MRTERWWQETSVVDHLTQHAGRFEFIQAVRILRHVSEQPKKLLHWSDQFKFHTSFSLNFPATEIEQLTINDEQIEITNLIVGLTGMQGALPYTYTNKVRQAPRAHRTEVREFLGLFNHQLIAQYVDSSLTYNLPVRYEIEPKNDYLDILHALNGYIRHQHNQPELDDYFAEFAGLMQGQNNTVHALKTMLNCVFKQSIHIQEYIRESFRLDEQQRTSLGGNQPSLLGVNTFCGDTIQQLDGKIEIQIGPLKRQHYVEFLPHGSAYRRLKSLIQSWCNPTLFVDIRLILDKSEIEGVCLSKQYTAGLGHGAFLMPSSDLADNTETLYPLIGAAA